MTYGEVIEWWKEYGFTHETEYRSDVEVLLDELYNKMCGLNDEERWIVLLYAWEMKELSE